jgi:1,4-dihydroxy-2-naphthoate octaprenyltransferase
VSKPESIVALTGLDWRLLLVAAFAMLFAGVWIMAGPLASCGSSLPAAMLMAAIFCGYLYQGPPFRCVLVPSVCCTGQHAENVHCGQR